MMLRISLVTVEKFRVRTHHNALRFISVSHITVGLAQARPNNTTIGQRTFNYRGAKIWNSLDNKYKANAFIEKFSEQIKERHVGQTLYLIIDYFNKYFYILLYS